MGCGNPDLTFEHATVYATDYFWISNLAQTLIYTVSAAWTIKQTRGDLELKNYVAIAMFFSVLFLRSLQNMYQYWILTD